MSISRYTGSLACAHCGSTATEADAFRGCSRCYDHGVATNPAPCYDLADLAAAPVDVDQPGIFRYRALLPIAEQTRPVSLGEGGTPLLSLDRLGSELGLRHLYLKDEARNPTWSYKDRLAAVAVTKAIEMGATKVVVSSSGNHGAAAAAYAAAAGLPCVVLTMAAVPPTMNVLMQSFTPHVVALARPEHRWALMRQLVEQRGWSPLSGYLDPPAGSNTFGIDGYKTLAFELVDDLAGRAPDVIVAAVAYGDALFGMWRGFSDLIAMGVVERMPRFVAVDPHGAYAAALAHGLQTTVADEDSVAFSVAVPSATAQGVMVIRASGGTALRGGNDAAILAAQRYLARQEGLFVEPSSALAVLGVEQLRDAGLLRDSERVVMINTSSGLKDVAAAATALAQVPTIAPTLDALDASLGKWG